MSDIYAYNNQFWKIKYKFEYTGEPQPFTLQPGKYLFICNGAPGGKCSSEQKGNIAQPGGSTYGILNLTKTMNMYAVVGGVGSNSLPGNIPGDGGYNGGGKGGIGFQTSSIAGAGGGGATDVRLSIEPDETVSNPSTITVPDGYTELEYISSDSTQWIVSDYYHNQYTDVEMICDVTYRGNSYEALFGSRKSTTQQQFLFQHRFKSGKPAFSYCDTETQGTFDFAYDQKIKIKTHENIAVWYDMNDQMLGSITSKSTYNVSASNKMGIFAANTISDNVAMGRTTMKLYSFKIFEKDKLVRYFIPCRHTSNIVLTSDNFEQGFITPSGSLFDDNRYVRSTEFIPVDSDLMRYRFTTTGIGGKELQLSVIEYDEDKKRIDNEWIWLESDFVQHFNDQTKYFKLILQSPDNDLTPADVDNISLNFEPVVGLYELCKSKFYTNHNNAGSDFGQGDVVTPKTEFVRNPTIKHSLLSRIIVAGGGGGQGRHNHDGTTYKYHGVGGGIYGGELNTTNYESTGHHATQDSGYEFGIGMDAVYKGSNQSNGADGSGGGGGGWYGGYAQSVDGSYTNSNGGGGSAYVVTEESYKPDGYTDEVPDNIKFTNIKMIGGSSYEPSVLILTPTLTYNVGDKIIFPRIGETEKIQLDVGEYVLKCWGGDGGPRKMLNSAARGGYAEGKLIVESVIDIYVNVAGSGIRYSSNYNDSLKVDSTLAFNGGGIAGNISDLRSTFGGGASDIRINENSLYARVIVAGGAGGHGSAESSSNRFGGAGGGLVGNNPNTTSHGKYGGGGTQIGVGSCSDEIIASFGNGGNGVAVSDGFGGAGGGGWYGGSGCYPDTSGDDDCGGSGGSGYVLTESSNKPIGYLLDETYHLTDTVLTTGGNDLPIGQTKVEIDVLNVSFVKIICKDDEGFKYYNSSSKQWEYLSDVLPDIETFQNVGVSKMVSDDGLLDKYEIYTCDIGGTANVDKTIFNVVPPPQTIRTKYYTKYLMNRFTIDADVDIDTTKLSVEASRNGIAEDAHIDFTIKCGMTDVPKIPMKMYCIHGYTQGTVSGYHKLPSKEKTLEHIDLLPVGTGNRMPSRYKSYIGGFINGTEGITTINSAVCCIKNRTIYSATLCNDNIVRIAKLNLVTNISTVIKDIPKSSLGNTRYGDIKVDDKYIYLTSSNNNNERTIWRLSLDPNDDMVNAYSPGTSSDYYFNAVGKMEWFDDHTIALVTRTGFLFFDTEKLTWRHYKCYNGPRKDMAVGKKKIIALYKGSTNGFWYFDTTTNTTHEWDETFASSYESVGCYSDGNFYVTQQNRLYIINEDTMQIERSVPTPYTNTTPKTIHYANGILYITIQNQMTLYIYDIANDRFYSSPIPFSIDNWQSDGWTRGVSFRGYFFLPQVRMFVINFAEYAKYNLGYKYDQFTLVTNKTEELNQSYEYDERFVTLTDEFLQVHVGDISFDMIQYDKCIKYCEVDKSQYTKLLKQYFVISENGEGNIEEKGDDNGA